MLAAGRHAKKIKHIYQLERPEMFTANLTVQSLFLKLLQITESVSIILYIYSYTRVPRAPWGQQVKSSDSTCETLESYMHDLE